MYPTRIEFLLHMPVQRRRGNGAVRVLLLVVPQQLHQIRPRDLQGGGAVDLPLLHCFLRLQEEGHRGGEDGKERVRCGQGGAAPQDHLRRLHVGDEGGRQPHQGRTGGQNVEGAL